MDALDPVETVRIVDHVIEGGVGEIVLAALAVILGGLLRRMGKSKAQTEAALARLQKVVSAIQGSGAESERVEALAEVLMEAYQNDPKTREMVFKAYAEVSKRMDVSQWRTLLESHRDLLEKMDAKVDPPGSAGPGG